MNPIKDAQEKFDDKFRSFGKPSFSKGDTMVYGKVIEEEIVHHLHARDRAIIAAVADIAENMRDVYDDDVDNRNDKYRIEGYNKALKEIITRLQANLE